MVIALIFAQAGADMGLELPLSSLVSSLSAAGAAVVVTYYFLAFLRDHGDDQKRVLSEFRSFHALSQNTYQNEIDRLAERREHALAQFREQVLHLTETQNAMLKEAVATMKTIEKSLEGSRFTIGGIETTLDTLRMALRALDAVLKSNHERANAVPQRRSEGDSP